MKVKEAVMEQEERERIREIARASGRRNYLPLEVPKPIKPVTVPHVKTESK